jgi:hypothetical protein
MYQLIKILILKSHKQMQMFMHKFNDTNSGYRYNVIIILLYYCL